MSEELRESESQVLERLQRISWTVMDEEQRDEVIRKVVVPRYMAVTKDGVKLGPTWWAEALGAETEGTVRNRVQRARSKGQSERAAPDWKSDRGARAARQIARENPAEILKDPTARRSLEAALDAAPLPATNGHARKTVEEQAPGERLLMEFYAWFIRGKRLLSLAHESGRLNKQGREDLAETAEQVRNLVDLIESIGTSGDWDEELAAMVEGGGEA